MVCDGIFVGVGFDVVDQKVKKSKMKRCVADFY